MKWHDASKEWFDEFDEIIAITKKCKPDQEYSSGHIITGMGKERPMFYDEIYLSGCECLERKDCAYWMYLKDFPWPKSEDNQ